MMSIYHMDWLCPPSPSWDSYISTSCQYRGQIKHQFQVKPTIFVFGKFFAFILQSFVAAVVFNNLNGVTMDMHVWGALKPAWILRGMQTVSAQGTNRVFFLYKSWSLNLFVQMNLVSKERMNPPHKSSNEVMFSNSGALMAL